MGEPVMASKIAIIAVAPNMIITVPRTKWAFEEGPSFL